MAETILQSTPSAISHETSQKHTHSVTSPNRPETVSTSKVSTAQRKALSTTNGHSSTQYQHRSPSTQNPYPYKGAVIGLSCCLVVLLVFCVALIVVIWKLKRNQGVHQKVSQKENHKDNQEDYETVEAPKKPTYATTLSATKNTQQSSHKAKSNVVTSPTSHDVPATTAMELQENPPPRPPKSHSSSGAAKYPGITEKHSDESISRVESSITGNEQSEGVTNHGFSVDENTRPRAYKHLTFSAQHGFVLKEFHKHGDRAVCSSKVYVKLNRADKTTEEGDALDANAENTERLSENIDSARNETVDITDTESGDTGETNTVPNDNSARTSTVCIEIEDNEENDISKQRSSGREIYDDVNIVFKKYQTK